MRPRPQPSRLERWEARLRTGPVAHLLGGVLDLGQALARVVLQRLRGRHEHMRRRCRRGRRRGRAD